MVGSAGTCQPAAAARRSQARRRARSAYDAGMHLRPRGRAVSVYPSEPRVEPQTTFDLRPFGCQKGKPSVQKVAPTRPSATFGETVAETHIGGERVASPGLLSARARQARWG